MSQSGVKWANAFDLALIMHPIGPVRRTSLYNMVLILLSIIAAPIGVAMIHHSFGSLARSGIAREKIAMPEEHAEQSRVAGQTTQFLVVVLPDGKVVIPVVADRF